MAKGNVSGMMLHASVLLGVLALTPLSFAQAPQLPQPMGNVRIASKPPDAHWVWVADFQGGLYGRSILYDADAGSVLGMIDTGWEGMGLVWAGDRIYNGAMYMSRGFRGERTDVVATYDAHTLEPLREVIIPPRTIHGFPDLNHASLTDDNRHMLLQLMAPASSIGVVDVDKNTYQGEIETSGCINAMPAGDRSFFSLCGDGSLLQINLTSDGKEHSRKRYPRFFDVEHDPLHESAVRSGDTWYFVSWSGQVHAVDVSAEEFRFLPTWSVSKKEGDRTWIPGQPMQTIAVHDRQRLLYVLMHHADLTAKLNGSDSHRQLGTEVWVFSLEDKTMRRRIVLSSPSDAIAVSQDDSPLLYATSMFHMVFSIQDAMTGEPLREIPFPSFPTVIQPVD